VSRLADDVAICLDTYTSGHDKDDWCSASSDKPLTTRTSKVVAHLGGALNDDQVSAVGVGYPQEFSGYVCLVWTNAASTPWS